MAKQAKDERLYFLDWLRAFAVILLVPYHTGMIFVVWNWHIKNDVTSIGLTIVNAFIRNWHMPVFFILSGASTWFALNKRGTGEYIKERFLRLFVPLLFGMMVIVPPQTFYERLQKSQFDGTYFDFYPHLFNGFYPEGNMTWNHLWFLSYLFFISMFVLPLLLHWKSERGASLIARMNAWLAEGHHIFVLCIPLAIIQMALKVAFPGPQTVVSDWARIFFMTLIFIYGAMLYPHSACRESFNRNRWVAFATGMAILAFFVALHFSGFRFTFGYNLPNILKLGVQACATWCWLIVFFGFSQRHLNFSNRFIKYAGEAVLPFYILHQTVIIVCGYHIVATDLPLMIKYVIINVLSFILIVAIYDIIVKRIGALRFLFGMRPMKKKKA